ncbi:uncharacterized protein FIBRA_06418 [Fibroporia radiculosa]|uniref:NAD-dependent epimerase/dehydratase domain-containing protein n=1 Tax=Fibroporia radiculosa TaxID=599839 RepID=J4IB91_9APHY|nr:uncharacterized protein FIBRA_06418 [Fibroporia radiculosa]CCM04251.1 predicted protein [Fibroporia radiculosa]
MPPISSGRVLVTGANGYIAIWIVRSLLERGYSVRGTVRSEDKAKHLHDTFTAYWGRFETVIVEDITEAGAFDEAVKDVSAIVHTASPVYIEDEDPDKMIVPGVKGTVRVLESALANGSSVQRIVYTSSSGSVLQLENMHRTYSEADWNDAAVETVKEKGYAASQMSKYCASKTLAERAAWEFVEKNRNRIDWDFVALNPPFVFGPVIHEVEKPTSLNASMIWWFYNVVGGQLHPTEIGMCWIDVRDLAEAHIRAMERKEAGGERIIVAEGTWKWEDWVNAFRQTGASIHADSEAYAASVTHQILFDTSKAARLLELSYRSPAETTHDVLEDFRTRGWI